MHNKLIRISTHQRWTGTLLLALSLLNGCGSAGPYVDPLEPDAMDGPGLFSGDKGEFSMIHQQRDSSSQRAETGGSVDEFEAYRQWKSLDHSSAEYQRFLQWLEYQKFKIQP